MTPASAHLLELLGQLRGASRLGRARTLALAAKALRDLSPAERRVLATEAAKRVAPHLLPQVDDLVEEKLSAAEAGKFMELFNKLDSDAIADLARDVAAALDAPAADAAPSTPDPEDDMDLIADIAVDDTAGRVQPMELVAELSDLPPSLDEPWAISVDQDPEPEPHSPVLPVAAAATAVAVLPRPASAAELIPPLDEVPEGPPGAALERLLATPDGWQRRRLAIRLVERGEVSPSEALDIIAAFAATSDRTWVAGALLDARVLTFDDVEDLVPPTAHNRLQRRGER